MIKTIQTEYKGFLFRSRLEAKWAVFFDSLRITWVYEEEGFVLSNGKWYLPDFYLPDFNNGTYVEVKPKALTQDEREKCRLLCYGSKKAVWLAVGVPDFMCYEVFYFDNNIFLEGDGIPNADQAEFENRFYGMSAYGQSGGRINPEYKKLLGDTFINAVKEAKQATFEFLNKK